MDSIHYAFIIGTLLVLLIVGYFVWNDSVSLKESFDDNMSQQDRQNGKSMYAPGENAFFPTGNSELLEQVDGDVTGVNESDDTDILHRLISGESDHMQNLNDVQLDDDLSVSGPTAASSSSALSTMPFQHEQMKPSDLLPSSDGNAWKGAVIQAPGDLADKNFLEAGFHAGINTVGQTNRNPNLQLRSEPPNPRIPAGPFNIPTIEADTTRRQFEIN